MVGAGPARPRSGPARGAVERGTLIRLATLACAGALVAVPLATAGSPAPSRASAAPAGGRVLYRRYCGQCHALTAALAAGFGTENGLGTDGGPSFNTLRISFKLSVLALTLPFIGHEVLVRRLNWAQIVTISRYLALVTRGHPQLALSTDG